MSNGEVTRLLRPHISFNLALKTTVAKQLYGVSIRMANMLTDLTMKAQRSLPPDQAKKVMAASFEIIHGVREHLENEKAALRGRQIQSVTNFPVRFAKNINLIFPNAVAVLQMLVDLDKMAQQWYDLWFLGELNNDDFEEKLRTWRHRFRQASVKINSLNRSCRFSSAQSGPDSDQQIIEASLSAKRRSR